MLDVRDFGAVGDGVADDRAAIQAAIDTAVADREGGILLPAGTYRVSRVDDPGARWSLDLRAVEDFQIVGEGPASTVKLVDTQLRTSDWHVFILRDGCRRIVFRDLVVDGNRSGLADPDEQSHGIEVESGTEDLTVSGCILRECFGDGIRLLGTPAANVRRVRIHDCLFQRNKRSGLGVQRALEHILLEGCIFDDTISDQSIDFEPSGADGPTDILIHGCIVRHTNRGPAVTIAGIRGADPAVRVKLSDSTILGGQVFCVDVAHLTIENTTVVVDERETGNRPPLQVQRGGDGVLIANNLLINDDTGTGAVISLSEVNQRQVTRAMVTGNLCFTRSGNGVQVNSSDDVIVNGNMLVATGECGSGVVVRSETSNVHNISVRHNDVTTASGGSWQRGMFIVAAESLQLSGLSIVDNAVSGAAAGVRFQGPGFSTTPFCALNRMDESVTTHLVGLARLPECAVTVGGAAGPGAGGQGGRTLIGADDPNGRVTGDVGDIFQRIDGGAGATLYVKESGPGTTTGWSAK